MSKIGTINTTGTIFKPTITNSTYDELMTMINTPLNVSNALIFSVPQNSNGEDIVGEGSIWLTDGDGYLYPISEPVNNTYKTFEFSKEWYDYDFNIQTSVNKNHTIYYTNSSDGIYSKPIYLKPGKYVINIYIDNTNVPNNDYYIYFYGNKYPSDLNTNDPISFNMKLTGNYVQPILNKNQKFYEYTVELNLTKLGFYSFNLFANSYNIYIP